MVIRRTAILYFLSCVVSFASGCGNKPNAANIELRKQLQSVEAEKADLQRQHTADQATIAALKSERTTVPILSEERLAKLFTTHGITFNRLTGGDAKQLKVYVTPIDHQAQPLKSAGGFVIEAFDLALPGNQKIGSWTFNIEQSRAAWNGTGLLYGYIFAVPWQTVPAHADLTIKVIFTDELTHRQFTEQKQIKVEGLSK